MHVEARGQEYPGQVPQGQSANVGPWPSRPTQTGTNLRVNCKVNFYIWSAVGALGSTDCIDYTATVAIMGS